MKRFQYGLNSTVFAATDFFRVQPIGYVEVAPGDSISGSVETKWQTDTTKRRIENRVYKDIAAFYVPYRLLWDEWPSWIAGPEAPPSESLPTVTDACEWNFEPEAAEHNAFQRYAFNMIYNQYYRPNYLPERTSDDATAAYCSMRPSTFEQRVFNEGTIRSNINLTGPVTASVAEINVDQVRAAFAQDRWQKTRDYYGSKYIDYLRALGVDKQDWSVLDEPELLATAQAEAKFRDTPATTFDSTEAPDQFDPVTPGTVGGNWRSVSQMNMKRSFHAEHGLIVFIGVMKIDFCPNVLMNYPHLLKTTREEYYSPEFEHLEMRPYSMSAAERTASRFVYAQPFQDYRAGINMSQNINALAPSWNQYYWQPNIDLDDPRKWQHPLPAETGLDDIFVGNLCSDPAFSNISIATMMRLKRLSPIRPPALRS